MARTATVQNLAISNSYDSVKLPSVVFSCLKCLYILYRDSLLLTVPL